MAHNPQSKTTLNTLKNVPNAFYSLSKYYIQTNFHAVLDQKNIKKE